MSLGIRTVWSGSSLCAQWVVKDPRFLHADSEDSDQTGRMPRLIWVFAGRTLILLVLSCRGSVYTCSFPMAAIRRENINLTKKKNKKNKKKTGNQLSLPPKNWNFKCTAKFVLLHKITFFFFFFVFQNLCDPIGYKPMLHTDHGSDLRHFRVKSKSWTAGEKQKRKPLKRSMSRLNLAF